MLRKTRRFPSGGFTLIEVMSAAAVLALALVGMIQVVVSGSEMLDVSKKQTIAMQIIHGQLEQIRLLSWDQVGLLGSTDTRSVEAGDDTSSGKMFLFGPNLPGIAKGFVCKRTIETVKTDLKLVTVTVTWTGNTGRSYSRSGTTYVAKNGLYVTYQRT
jgi:prepilin-type N-terminal cleavage/methylation domain-containing protein